MRNLTFYSIAVLLLFSCTMKRQMIEIYNTGAQFKTFKEAIDNCKDGDSIIVYPGKYIHADEINLFANYVSIVGVGKPQILCTSMEENVLWVLSDHVVIKNLKLSHIKPEFWSYCTGNVLALDNADDVLIENCDINGCGRIGVYMFSATNVVLNKNWIHNNSLSAVQIDGVDIFSATDDYPGIIKFDRNKIEKNGGGTNTQ
jgi:parallel beta-helix repeat protein